MKFNVGDKVRILTQKLYFTFKIGTVGIVSCAGVNRGTYSVRCDGDCWTYFSKDLELIERQIEPTAQIRHILSRHISNKRKMELIAEVVASNQT